MRQTVIKMTFDHLKWCVENAALFEVDLNGKHFLDEHMFIHWSMCNGEHIKWKSGKEII